MNGKRSFEECEGWLAIAGRSSCRRYGRRCPGEDPDLLPAQLLRRPLPADVAKDRAEKLSQDSYALLPAFLMGMLDVIGDAKIIDGNENSYYYTDSAQHYSVYHLMKQRALMMVDPSLVGRVHGTRAGRAGALHGPVLRDARGHQDSRQLHDGRGARPVVSSTTPSGRVHHR